MKAIFAGTPEFAVPTLQALLEDTAYEVNAVLTQPDRPAGRGRKLTASPVKELAQRYDIPVHQPERLRKDFLPLLAQYKPDVIVVVAYGLLLPTWLLNLPTYGCLNVHASLLPRWRGAAPIQYAILNGDDKTGISIMKMEKGLDTGPVYRQISCPIVEMDTAESLHDRLKILGATSLLTVLKHLNANSRALLLASQPEIGVTYAKKIEKIDAQLNWQQSAVELSRVIRAYNPWPVAYSYLNETLIKIYQASIVDEKTLPLSSTPKFLPGTISTISEKGILVSTATDKLCLQKIQLPGGKILKVAEYLRGHKQANPFKIGERFQLEPH